MPTRASSFAGSFHLRLAPRGRQQWRRLVERTATSMFSITVIRGKIRHSWNLRPIPARAILCEALPVMSSPRYVARPGPA